jgi:hypothetical protein
MGFFQNIANGISRMFSGKNSNGIHGFLNKAKNFIGTGMNILNSKPIRGLVDSVSQHVPGVGSLYKDFKKYGNVANNLLNGGAEKMGERFIRDSPILRQMDRWDRPSKRSDWHSQDERPQRTIERRVPKMLPDELNYGL